MSDFSSTSDAAGRRSPGVWLLVLFLVAVFGVLLLWRGGRPPEAGVGKQLAALDLAPLKGGGKHVTLADLAGKVVLVNFFATWCGPCQAELPHTAGLYRELSGNDAFVLLAVSCGDDDPRQLRSDTEDLLAQMNLDLPAYTDPTGTTRDAFWKVAGQTGFPTNFVLDRRGVIRAIWVGYGPGLEDEIEAAVRRLLDERPAEPRPKE